MPTTVVGDTVRPAIFHQKKGNTFDLPKFRAHFLESLGHRVSSWVPKNKLHASPLALADACVTLGVQGGPVVMENSGIMWNYSCASILLLCWSYFLSFRT